MNFEIGIDPATGERCRTTSRRGHEVLIDATLNKGTAFTSQEREELGLHGLLPPAACTIEQQLERVYENFSSKTSEIEKYIFLTALHDRNETLFFRALHEHIDEMMPIIYTPVVGEACQKFSHIYRRAQGMYVGYDQRHDIPKLLANFHAEEPSVIVVTDGERILGLGDQGAGGMGIPIGKLCLYTLCAGVPPHTTLPILLDAGTDNQERLADPLYLGLRQPRVRGDAYQAFVDAFVEAVTATYPNVLIQWEDFLKANAIRQLERFRDRACSFNDDIQGTAAVVLAGIYASLRITGGALRDQRLVIAGAGASAHGICDLVVSALAEEGLAGPEARRRIWTVDSRGLVTRSRPDVEDFKLTYARDAEEVGTYQCRDRSAITLEETVLNAEPTILLGSSGSPGVFTEAVVGAMAARAERPIIFPLSNPTSKAECTPAEALGWCGGRAIVATGSPFPPVDHDGRRFRIGQCNNAFVFPGVGLGVWVGRVRRVTDEMFLDAAKALAGSVSASDLEHNAVFPELGRIRDISHAVACAVIRRAVDQGHAEEEILDDLEATLRNAMWSPEYVPLRYRSAPR